uniref:Uncharacterized protein n=1 Tax=Gopherus agassizii TaxID=38772 RepID=A0A452HY48_9SAUR
MAGMYQLQVQLEIYWGCFYFFPWLRMWRKGKRVQPIRPLGPPRATAHGTPRIKAPDATAHARTWAWFLTRPMQGCSTCLLQEQAALGQGHQPLFGSSMLFWVQGKVPCLWAPPLLPMGLAQVSPLAPYEWDVSKAP